MKKKILFVSLLCILISIASFSQPEGERAARTALLPTQITQEQANAIVWNHIQDETSQSCLLYVNMNAPSAEGIAITTSNGETVRAKYACWAYYLNESPGSNTPARRRYLFVQEESGNLLEIIANNDLGPGDLSCWKPVNIPFGIVEKEVTNITPYPNPVDDWLTLPCSEGRTRVEIHDLKGTRLFSGLVLDDAGCRLNVSFLSAGVYMVSVSGETRNIYKIIKN